MRQLQDDLSASGAPLDTHVQAWVASHLAWLLRLGVAAGHVSVAEARRQTASIAAQLRRRYADWFSYGDAVAAATAEFTVADVVRLRADLRTLYAPDGPWANPEWPPAGG